jgi:hypothetical protein
MSILFEVGVIHYTHSVVVIIAVSPRFLEYIEFVIGMHLQGHWGDVSIVEYETSDIGLLAGTSVSSAYDLVEEFEQLGGAVIIVTDLLLAVTIVSMSEEH